MIWYLLKKKHFQVCKLMLFIYLKMNIRKTYDLNFWSIKVVKKNTLNWLKTKIFSFYKDLKQWLQILQDEK